MTINNDETVILNENVQLSFESLLALSGLSEQELLFLVESGALAASQQTKPYSNTTDLKTLHFNSHYLISIRKLCRLKQDFELEPNALGLTLVFLERVRILELQLLHLNSQTLA